MPPVKALTGEDLMHAVARGAAYYVPRTYYVAVESAMPSIPGFPAPIKALAVVPFGMEEGTDTRIPGREFGLVVGTAGRVPILHHVRAARTISQAI
jgi:hypothetical protein